MTAVMTDAVPLSVRVQMIQAAAHGLGLTARVTVKLVGKPDGGARPTRTITRHEHGARITVMTSQRDAADVIADVADGVLVANRIPLGSGEADILAAQIIEAATPRPVAEHVMTAEEYEHAF